LQKLGHHELPQNGGDSSICTSTAYEGCQTPWMYGIDVRWTWFGSTASITAFHHGLLAGNCLDFYLRNPKSATRNHNNRSAVISYCPVTKKKKFDHIHKYCTVAFHCCDITKFWLCHKYVSVSFRTPTNSSAGYFLSVRTFSHFAKNFQFLAAPKIPTRKSKGYVSKLIRCDKSANMFTL